jgi:molybdate transport system substrate-binding protein
VFLKSSNLLLIVFFVSLLSGCASQTALPDAAKPPAPQNLSIAASDSLALAFKELGAQFERKNNVKITFSWGSSQTLSHQIESGVTSDIIAVTDVPLMEKLKANGKILPETLESYAPQKLVVAAVKGASGERMARRFIQYMNETEGQLIMERHGFVRPVK